MDPGTTSIWKERLRFDGLWWRKFAYLGCVYGPEWWKRCSPAAIAAIIFALVGRNRRGAIANLARVCGEPTGPRATLTALRMFSEFAHCMTETMEYYGPRPQPIQLDRPETDPLADALREGHGAVIVTGHFGNWDIAGKVLREYQRPINMVMARENNTSTHDYVRQAREQAGVRVIYSDSSVFSSLNMIAALRRNEIVALQLDRTVGTGGARLVPFFGLPTTFPSGPFVLARLAEAPLIPVFVPRLGTRHYAIRVGTRQQLSRACRDSAALDEVMTAVVGLFEQMIREFPTQWFQFASFWPVASPTAEAASVAADRRSEEPRRAQR